MMYPLQLARSIHDEICDSRSFVEEAGYTYCPKCKYIVAKEVAAGDITIGVSDKIPLKGQ
jgi:hypothetical protein